MADKKRRLSPFLDVPEDWEKHWQGMPEFVQEDKQPYKSIIVHFKTKQDMNDFMKIVQQKFTMKSKFIWHPKHQNISYIDEGYKSES